MSAAGTVIATQELESGWVRGGADQIAICESLKNDFNAHSLNRAAGLVASLVQRGPTRESSRKNGRTEYRYFCTVNVAKHPVTAPAPSAECGVSDRFMYQIGGSAPAGQTHCLSCDELDNAPMEQLVACLQSNIRDIVNARAVELRADDLAPMRAKVAKILEYNRVRPIANLQSFEQISLFMDFVPQR